MSVSSEWYGSDQAGLVCGYVFSQDGIARSIGSTEAANWLKTTASMERSEFIWLHFHLANTAAEKWLRTHLDLPDAFFESLGQGSRSTRIEYADEALIAIVNDVLYDFSFEASEVATLWLSVDQHRLISIRRQPLRSIDRL